MSCLIRGRLPALRNDLIQRLAGCWRKRRSRFTTGGAISRSRCAKHVTAAVEKQAEHLFGEKLLTGDIRFDLEAGDNFRMFESLRNT